MAKKRSSHKKIGVKRWYIKQIQTIDHLLNVRSIKVTKMPSFKTEIVVTSCQACPYMRHSLEISSRSGKIYCGKLSYPENDVTRKRSEAPSIPGRCPMIEESRLDRCPLVGECIPDRCPIVGKCMSNRCPITGK